MSAPSLGLIRNERAEHLAVGAFLLALVLSIALYWIQLAILLQLLIPGTTLLVAGWLYATRPALYLGFTWWLWLTIPFIRRVIDLQTGFDPRNLVMTAPLVATLFAVVTVIRYGGKLRTIEFAPYALALAAVAHGFLVGIVKESFMGVMLSTLSWLLPIALGFHLHALWRLFPQHRASMLSVFRWGILVVGSYGLLQYVAPPAWDQAWMIASEMSSIGSPEPFQVRVFSMLNAPGPFASIALAGLILLFSDRSLIGRIAMGPGFVSFLLSLVRAAWGGWILALAFMGWRASGPMRTRLITLLVAAAIVITPLLFVGPIYSRIESRANTVANVESDNSFRARTHFFKVAAQWVLINPIGTGLGSTGRAARFDEDGGITSFDNGILAVPFTLGWLGALLYFGAVGIALYRIVPIRSEETDIFVLASAAIAISLVFQLIFSNSFVGIKGLLFWTFFGLSMAGLKHFRLKEKPSKVGA